MTSFAQWLTKNVGHLRAGHELLLPFTLSHPAALGFRETRLPSFGQLRDWTLELRRGRLVVHELAHGQCIIRLERATTRPVALLVEALAAALVSVGGRGLASLAR